MKGEAVRVLFIAVSVLPLAAHAEVSDKVPSQLSLWVEALALSFLVIVLSRWRIWLSLVPAAVSGLLFYASWDTFRDPFLAAVIRSELGSGYEKLAYLASALPVLVAVIVAALYWRRQNAK